MYFIVIMAFAFVLSEGLPPRSMDIFRLLSEGGEPAARSVAPTLAIIVAQLGLIAATAYITRSLTLRRLSRSPADHEGVSNVFANGQRVLLGMLAAGLVITMLLTPWLPLVRTFWRLDSVPVAGDLTILAPFFASCILMWLVLYRAELQMRLSFKALPPTEPDAPGRMTEATSALAAARGGRRDPTHSIGAYLLDKCRHQLFIIAVPMTVIVFARFFTSMYREQIRKVSGVDWGADALLGCVSAGVLVVSPLMLRFVWNTESLPDGPLRRRFERICARIGLRYRDILLWHTHGMAVNAAVMGFFAPLRYILVSDALLETMDEEEIEAVFGHEAGHVRHYHLQFFMIFVLVTMYITEGLRLFLIHTRTVADSGWLQLISMATLLASWLFGFGWVSRLFERQADLYGVRCVTPDILKCVEYCPVHGQSTAAAVPVAAASSAQRLCTGAANLFGRTLLRIADLNGIPKDAPSWRHGSIESRCRLIERLATSPLALRQFDRKVYGLKAGLLAAVVIGTAVAAKLYYSDIARAIAKLFA
jgi:STE24 endopeptidase